MQSNIWGILLSSFPPAWAKSFLPPPPLPPTTFEVRLISFLASNLLSISFVMPIIIDILFLLEETSKTMLFALFFLCSSIKVLKEFDG